MAERASLEEVLEFANKVREAGSGTTLDALMPAIPGNSTQCLLAKNFNFNSTVNHKHGSNSYWYIQFEDEQIKDAVRVALDLEDVSYSEWDGYETVYRLRLPDAIGQVAEDFDVAEEVLGMLQSGLTEDVTDSDIELVNEMLPFIAASVRDTFDVGRFTEDGKLIR